MILSIRAVFGSCAIIILFASVYALYVGNGIKFLSIISKEIEEGDDRVSHIETPIESCPKPFYPSRITLPNGVKIRYFVDPMPNLPTLKPTTSFDTHDVFNISITDIQQKVHSDVPKVTLRGYNGMSPGPTIHAYQGRKYIIHWKNDIPIYSQVINNIETIPANLSTTGIVTHLHGTYTDDYSDGLPLNTVQSGETFSATYINMDNPMTLFYHDHAYGITRANVYKGLSGFYILHSKSEKQLNLPTGDFDFPMLIQDRNLAPDAKGNIQFDYPDKWTEEVFGDIMLVNGVIWPYKNMTASKYRLRITNGSNSRFLNLFFFEFNSIFGHH